MTSHMPRFSLAAIARADRRFAIRTEVEIEFTVCEPDRVRVPATMIDFSIGGCRFAVEPTRMAGNAITVLIPGLNPIPAQIIWRDAGVIGCQFHDLLSAGHCQMLMQMAEDMIRD